MLRPRLNWPWEGSNSITPPGPEMVVINQKKLNEEKKQQQKQALVSIFQNDWGAEAKTWVVLLDNIYIYIYNIGASYEIRHFMKCQALAILPKSSGRNKSPLSIEWNGQMMWN